MKRGTAAKVILGKNTLLDVPAGIVHGTDVILGGKAGLLNDFGGLVLSNNLMLGKKISRSRATTVTVRGTSPLNLPDAIANSLSYVKAFGGTEQRNIPDNYLQRQFIYMLDGSYLLTDIVPASNYKVEMDFQTTNVTTASEYYLGVRDVSGGVEGLDIVKRPSSVGGALAFDGFQAGNRYVSSYVPTSNTRYKYTYDNGTITLTKDNTVVASHTFTPDSTVTSKLAINGFNDNGSVLTSPTGIYLYSFKVWNAQGELVLDLVPAVEKGAVPVVGFYDTVSKSFMTATAGTFAAGTEAVPSPATPMDIVSNNGVLKARHQSGLPLRYQLVEWLRSTDGFDITGFKTKDTQTFKAKFMKTSNYAQYAYCSDTSSSGTTNTTAYIVGSDTSSGNWRFDGTAAPVTIAKDTLYESIQSKGGVWLNGDQVAEYSDVNNFTSNSDLYVFGISTSPNAPLRLYGLQVEENGVKVLDIVPVKDTVDGTYGVYDLVGGQFYTNSDATITAGNPVSDPVEIYADGTVETINAHGKNLFDQSTATRYKTSWNANGTIAQETVDSVAQTYGFSVKPNTTYTIQKKNGNRLMIGGFTSVKVPTSQSLTADFQIRMSTTDMNSYTFTTPAGCVWILFSVRNNTVSSDLYPLATDIQIELGSTATEYEPYYNGGIATAEMLLKVGDYQDEQEILSGAVTRKVGVKVLDGTEDWTASGAAGRYYTAISDMFSFSGRSEGLCSHYNYSGASGAGLNTYFFTTARRLFVYTEYETATDFKAYLAAQYAAGTPVIVLYPLATPTTESVAGQTLQVQAGDNVLEITQASLDNLELEAQYKAAVQLTIQEVEDANLDNNVEVTIS